MSFFSIKLDNRLFDFKLSLTIFQACLIKKIFIPRFCYHEALKIAGNCRMCLIEEKAALKPLASCAVSIINGHIIYTNTETVKKAREGVLEYLLINHPLDCPICDQGGECDSQDQTMVFGADRGRFYEYKRSTSNKNLGFLIKTFLNRCIHCARCTRFLNEIAGTNDLQLLGRGLKTEISNFTYNFIKSEISGNILDSCPVGALVSKPFSFKARSWELISINTFDILDGFGANIQLDFRGLDLVRILPKINKFLNEEWISDRTRFSYDALNIQRLINPYLIFRCLFQKLNWFESLIYLKNIFFLKKNLDLNLNFGDFLDSESRLSIKNFFSFSSLKNINNQNNNLNKDFRFSYGIRDMKYLDINTENIETLNYIIINSNLRFESPIINLKLRKIFSNLENKIFIIGFISNFNFDYIHINMKFSKFVLNFIVQKKKKIILSTTQFFFNNLNYISNNITKMIKNDLNLNFYKNNSKFNYIFLNLGQPENYLFFFTGFFHINILHHIEDEFLKNLNPISKILIPTNFFFEKNTTYINNSFNFFNMLSHFSIKIPNTKPEWKIINAINEFINNDSLKFYNLIFYIPNLNFRLKSFFKLVFFDSFFDKLKRFSLINNFYFSNIVIRLSFIMNLCSNKLTISNDYIYNTIN